ncbi:kinase-like domain-containing protein [Phyllosticta citribraziliensis]|uniref:Kinase-like domain-containing protein n=1 Tax=Phyllosticta citribraziliensis TaxID=989973 RepID=A0ABR1L8T5_9PEZI
MEGSTAGPDPVTKASENKAPERKGWEQRELVTVGISAMIYRISEDRIIKIPKVRTKDEDCFEYWNEMCRDELQREKAAVERLASHPHIIQCFGISDPVDGIKLEYAFANQGSAGEMIRQKKPPPPLDLRKEWFWSLADALNHVHSRRVFHGDVHLLNVLMHNDAVMLCDFGQSDLLPLDTDMASWKSEGDETVQVEMLLLGYVFYSIMVWKETRYDWWDTKTFPEAGDRPILNGVPYAAVIHKCWTGGCRSMDDLRSEVFKTGDDELLCTPGS